MAVTNADRAEWAAKAVQVFAKTTDLDIAGDYTEEEPQVAIGDLLTNLMHLCDQKGLRFERILNSSRETYKEEVWEERQDREEVVSEEELYVIEQTGLHDDPLGKGPLYWSNRQGWVSLDCADQFTLQVSQTVCPVAGGRWVPLSEAEPYEWDE